MSWMDDIASEIQHLPQKLSNTIAKLAEEETYQSPLELMGIAMRAAKKPVCYYGKHYPYATAVQTDIIRTNQSYVSASGWRPSTCSLKTDIHNREWEDISGNFDVQTGGGQYNQNGITNMVATDATLAEAY